MTVSIYNDVVTQMPDLTDEELDLKLEEAVIESEKAEMLVCCYLAEVRERRLFERFGYANISDYAVARFGFKERKTHYLVRLGKRIKRLPKLREAMANGKIGWCKASRLADFVAPENEVMWIQSALSSPVQQLEQKIKGRYGHARDDASLPAVGGHARVVGGHARDFPPPCGRRDIAPRRLRILAR